MVPYRWLLLIVLLIEFKCFLYRTIFCAVPALSLVLPVTNSGPTTTTTGISVASTSLLSGLQVMQPVSIPFSLALFIPPITYGVVPDAAMPITVSFVFMLNISSSFQALFGSSSADSTDLRNAVSPPAINPMTMVWGTPNVGGTSE